MRAITRPLEEQNQRLGRQAMAAGTAEATGSRGGGGCHPPAAAAGHTEGLMAGGRLTVERYGTLTDALQRVTTSFSS